MRGQDAEPDCRDIHRQEEGPGCQLVREPISRQHQRRGNNSLPWENARTAARDAWQRVEKRVPGEVDGNGY